MFAFIIAEMLNYWVLLLLICFSYYIMRSLNFMWKHRLTCLEGGENSQRELFLPFYWGGRLTVSISPERSLSLFSVMVYDCGRLFNGAYEFRWRIMPVASPPTRFTCMGSQLRHFIICQKGWSVKHLCLMRITCLSSMGRTWLFKQPTLGNSVAPVTVSFHQCVLGKQSFW